MKIENEGKAQAMTMRYTHLGACREGQSAVTMDPNSDLCAKMRAQIAAMDPQKSCARRTDDRAECEARMRGQAEKMAAMCR